MDHLGLSFLTSPRLWWYLAVAGALFAGVYTYYRLAAPLGRPLRQALRALRLLAFVILLLLLLEPVLTRLGESSGRPRLAVLVDRSSSMRLPVTAEGEVSRRDRAAGLLDTLQTTLADRFELDVRGFAGGLTARSGAEETYPWEPLGITAVGEALEEVLVQQGELPVGGILLVTDGVHTHGKDPALVARNLPVPVFGMTVGDTTAPPDLLVRQVRAQSVGYTGEPLAVRAILENRGLEGREVRVTVRARDELPGAAEVERRARLPQAVGRETEVRVDILPTHVGLTLLEVTASLLGADGDSAEAVTINNTRLIAIDVREKKTRILYVESEMDWDFAFLKRTFDADTTLSYDYLILRGEDPPLSYGTNRLTHLPSKHSDLSPYAAVILGRTPPTALPPDMIRALRAYVLGGGGLLFLGGATSTDLAAWARAWGELLPVSVRAERHWGFTESGVGVSLAGLTHEIVGLRESPAQTEEAWGELPPLQLPEGEYRTTTGAAILLTGRTEHPPREVPVLALAQAGAGRVGVFTGRGFWRWDFAMRAVRDELPLAREFWKRMTRWLSEPSQADKFVVSPVRTVFQDSEPLAFEARLNDDAYQPVPGARITLTLEPLARWDRGASEASRPVTLQLYPDGPAGRYAGTASALAPGAYRYRAEAGRPEEAERWTAEGRFWVEPMGAEYFELAADPGLTRLLAGMSGGLVAPTGNVSRLARALPDLYKRVRVVHQDELWNHWVLFGVLMVLLSMEWIARRWKGLA